VLLAAATFGWRPLVRLARSWSPGRFRAAGIFALLLLSSAAIIQAVPLLVSRARGTPPTEPVAGSLWMAARWIEANTPPDAVIQTTYDSRLHFATGRKTVPLPLTESPGPFVEIAQRYHPGYVFVLNADDGYFVPSDNERFQLLSRLFPSRLHLAYRFSGGSIYAFH
jgi:hypothetical protein